MQETITVIQNDSTLMLIGGISIAVLLVIVLVVVVSSMRVKIYKDRFKNLLLENKDKAEHITKVEKELQVFKIMDTQKTQELSKFDETKKSLKHMGESFLSEQKKANTLEKELREVISKLNAEEGKHKAFLEEFKNMKERSDALVEENSKYRTSNTRLLVKLETEERYVQEMKEKQGSK